MTRNHAALLALASLLSTVNAQKLGDARAYMEGQLLAAAGHAGLGPADFVIGAPKAEKGDGFVDSTIELRFERRGKPLQVRDTFIAALVHNIELGAGTRAGSGEWRLRRARLQRVPGADRSWICKQLVFGRRHEGKDGKGDPVPLPRARPAIWHWCHETMKREAAGTRWQSLTVDMTGKQPRMTAAIAVTGEDYKKRFFALESEFLRGCRQPKHPFVDARWRGDEEPAADGKGATFTLELGIREQLEPALRRPR